MLPWFCQPHFQLWWNRGHRLLWWLFWPVEWWGCPWCQWWHYPQLSGLSHPCPMWWSVLGDHYKWPGFSGRFRCSVWSHPGTCCQIPVLVWLEKKLKLQNICLINKFLFSPHSLSNIFYWNKLIYLLFNQYRRKFRFRLVQNSYYYLKTKNLNLPNS